MKLNEFNKSHTCSECGGPAFTDLILAEKKDACYYKVKASAKVWPSAYASGRLVQCRKKGASNYGNKSEGVVEGSSDTIYPNAEVIKSKNGKPVGEIYQDEWGWGCFHYKADRGASHIESKEEALEWLKDIAEEYRQDRSLREQGVAEDAVDDFLAKGGKIQVGKTHEPRKAERWQGSSHIGAAGGKGTKGRVSGKAANTNPKGGKPVVTAEDFNPEYDDEAGMAQGSLHTLKNAVEGLMTVIDDRDNLPEWCQEKISLAEDYLVTVWDYLQSEKAQGVDPEVEAMYEALEDLVTEMAHNNQVDADLVWEAFEAMPDNVLYETAAWRRKEGKSKTGGLNAKGVASYRRENPGSKLQTAVTTKPSKLKRGSKAAKRRKSFCARMSGVKGPMKKPNGKPTRKALALRKWNC